MNMGEIAKTHWVMDYETMINCFIACFESIKSDERHVFVVHDLQNDFDDYIQFIKTIEELGLDNISTISLDHDLGDSAMQEYFNNVSPNFKLDYNNITEKTGLDCAKWLVKHCSENNLKLPYFLVHSANPVGRKNIKVYLENAKKHLFDENN